MSDKLCFILTDNDKEFGELMKANEQFGVKRGLKATLSQDMLDELKFMFEALKTKGIHVTGFILDNNKGIEFLYHQNPKIKNNLKVIEPKDKYKM